jgi:diguanylate cyclase (GGDEF)-like protein
MTGDRPSTDKPLKGPMRDADASRQVLERRLGQQMALARFGQHALTATEREPLMAEAAALVHQALPPPAPRAFTPHAVADEADVAFAQSVADMLEAVGDKLRADEASRQNALHDPLTGLANRVLILDHLELALARAHRGSTLAAVIFFDLDDFKQVNDTYGHAAGDELLVRVTDRLRPKVRPADTLGRWGGDEFVVICEDLVDISDSSAIVERIATAFELPFLIHSTELRVTASIGIAVSEGAGEPPAALIHAADSAMYRAKREHSSGGGNGNGQKTVAFPTRLWRPKLDGLTDRLLGVLADLVVEDPASVPPPGC